MTFNICCSVIVSRELVISSKISISGLKYNALAIPILCLWPPDNLDPFSPTFVDNPFSRLLIKFPSWAD